MANSLSSEELKSNDAFLIFIIRACQNYKMFDTVKGIIDQLLKGKDPKKSKDLFLHIADVMANSNNKDKALEIFKILYEHHGKDDKMVQSKYLNILTEVNLAEAVKI